MHCAKVPRSKNVGPLTENKFKQVKRSAEARKEIEKKDTILQQINELPEEYDATVHGIHEKCYKNFTANIKRNEKRKAEPDLDKENECPTPAKSPRTGKLDRLMLFSNKCVFCDRYTKRLKNTTETTVKCATPEAAEPRILKQQKRKTT